MMMPRPHQPAAVATGHARVTETALDTLEAGGTAADAAIAATLVATLAEPILASLGGGLWLTARPVGGPPVSLDGFVQTPVQKRPDGAGDVAAIEADFGTDRQRFHVGWGTVATPGVIAGLFAAHDRFGRMPARDLFAPAIALARSGCPVNGLQARILSVIAPIVQASAGARHLFCDAQGTPLAEGGRYRPDGYAAFLDALAHEGPRLFYQGEAGQALATAAADGGGALTRRDLTGYTARWRPPIPVQAPGSGVACALPPSVGGRMVAAMLEHLGQAGLRPAAFGTAEHLRALVAASRAGERARPPALATAVRGTTHLSVIDGWGNAVALTLSNGEGAGRAVPELGLMPNNMLGEADLLPDGPDSWQPDTRLGSMMCPTLIERPDGGGMALGSGGSNRIRSALCQVIANLTLFGLSVPAAILAPRLHLEGRLLNAEAGLDDRAYAAARDLAGDGMLWPEHALFFGGVHVASAGAKGAEAVGDPRRDGHGMVRSG